MGYSLSMFICSACRKGPSVEGVTVSDPINTLHSLKHKKSPGKLICSCNATLPFND